MKPRPSTPVWPATLLVLATAVALHAALAAGGTAYTKRLETKLLAEPSALAAPVGKLAAGRPLKIEEARGAWLRVSDGPAAGWVFAGNVSALEIKESAGTAGLGLNASATTVTAAARGLSEDAADYAQRHNLTDAREDLAWLLEQSAAIGADRVDAFLQEKKLGEYK